MERLEVVCEDYSCVCEDYREGVYEAYREGCGKIITERVCV